MDTETRLEREHCSSISHIMTDDLYKKDSHCKLHDPFISCILCASPGLHTAFKFRVVLIDWLDQRSAQSAVLVDPPLGEEANHSEFKSLRFS